MKSYRKLFLINMLAAIFIMVPAVLAHRPEKAQPGEITQIPNASTSYAYYQELTTAVQADIYQIRAEAGQFFHAGINIPQIDGLENYGVSLALLGPGLPAVETAVLPTWEAPHAHAAAESGDHAHQDGLLSLLGLDAATGIVQESVVSEPFFEPFTQTTYWGRQTIELALPETGSYYLMVWQPDGQPGKYVLDTGRDEVFGADDLFRFPVWWVNTHIYFEHTPYLLAGLGGLLAAFALVFFFVRSRQVETAVIPIQK